MEPKIVIKKKMVQQSGFDGADPNVWYTIYEVVVEPPEPDSGYDGAPDPIDG